MKKLIIAVACCTAFSVQAQNEFNTPVKYNYIDVSYSTANYELDGYSAYDQDTSGPSFQVSTLPFEHVGFNASLGYSKSKFTLNGTGDSSLDVDALTYSLEVMPRYALNSNVDVFAGIGASYISLANDYDSDSDTALTYRGGINAALSKNVEMTLQMGTSNQENNPTLLGASVQYYLENNVALGIALNKLSDDYGDATQIGFNVRYSFDKSHKMY